MGGSCLEDVVDGKADLTLAKPDDLVKYSKLTRRLFCLTLYYQ